MARPPRGRCLGRRRSLRQVPGGENRLPRVERPDYAADGEIRKDARRIGQRDRGRGLLAAELLRIRAAGVCASTKDGGAQLGARGKGLGALTPFPFPLSLV